MNERLNKVLSRAGLASRRGADDLIRDGRVTINGEIVTDLGRRVEDGDEVRVDGERLPAQPPQLLYLALNKPRHVITTVSDPFDRPIVTDLVGMDERLFPVGRLDGASEGLIILTNDGDLANRLTHPRYEHEREYRVKISGTPTEETLTAWREGVWLDDGRTLPARVTLDSSTGPSSWVRFVLREGRNRQIRRMVEARRHEVLKLIRTRMGPIALGGLKAGEWRDLTDEELDALSEGQLAVPEEAKAEPKRERKVYKPGWARPKPKPNRHRSPKRPSSRK